MITINHNNIKLTVIKKPKEKDLKFIKENRGFHPLVTSELTHPTYYPTIENYAGHSLLIVRFPQFNSPKSEISPSEVDFILTKDELILFQYNDFEELDILAKELAAEEPLRNEYFQHDSAFLLYKILNNLLRSLYPQLDHIIKKVEQIEFAIFNREQESLVPEISLFRREAIDFKRIIAPNNEIFKELVENPPKDLLSENILPYFQELRTINSRLTALIESQTETLLVLHETNQSILSNKISSIMKVLTMFSVIVFPLTLFASIWGMNVENMPLIGHPRDFWILLAMMGLGTLTMLAVFKVKKWI